MIEYLPTDYLAAYIKDRQKRCTYLVTVYDIGRVYGGQEPEEWYYTVGSLLRTVKVFPTSEKAYAYCERLNTRLKSRVFGPNKGKYELWSVLSDGEYIAYVNKDFSTERFANNETTEGTHGLQN